MELLFPFAVRFGLVASRLLGVMLTGPLIGSRFFPRRIRISVAIILGLILSVAPGVAPLETIPIHVGYLFLLIIREVLIGVAIGLLVRAMVAAAMFAGSLVGTQMGLGVANVMDPQHQVQVTQTGMMLALVVTAALLAFDTHHVVVAALYRSFQIAPIGQLGFGPGAIRTLMYAGSEIFTAGVSLAAPGIVAVFMTNVGMALLARTMPQMNVFAVGFVLTIGVGLLVLGTTSHAMVDMYGTYRDELAGRIMVLVRNL